MLPVRLANLELLGFHYRAIVAIGNSIKHGDCWVYPSTNKEGYGITSVGGKSTSASRLVLCCATDKPLDYKVGKDFMDACHRTPLCRFRACLNPEHLYWDTKRNNSRRRELERAAAEVAKVISSDLFAEVEHASL
ncbi:MAG: hypothetical protein LAO23_04430 [Acidobacteriia bacterium]|nr:hypothetical protein [Terriglobia bacterium]